MSDDRTKDRRPGNRSRARERALQALYQVDVASANPSEALSAAWQSASDEEEESSFEPGAAAFAQRLVDGVTGHRPEVDKVIESHSHHWRLERMARVDRNILRLAVYELLHAPDVPKRVVINEAIELAKKFGTEESSAFINGILDKVAHAVRKEGA